MKFTLEIDCGNAAFDGELERDTEVARILRLAAERIEAGAGDKGRLLDINGNIVGKWEFFNES